MSDFEKVPGRVPHEPSCSVHGAVGSGCDCDGPAAEIARLTAALAEADGRNKAWFLADEERRKLTGDALQAEAERAQAEAERDAAIARAEAAEAQVAALTSAAEALVASLDHTSLTSEIDHAAVARIDALAADPSPAVEAMLAARENGRAYLDSTRETFAQMDRAELANAAFRMRALLVAAVRYEMPVEAAVAKERGA